MDMRGGWVIVFRGPSTFSDTVGRDLHEPIVRLLISHILHLHALYHGLNLTVALTHFRDTHSTHDLIYLPHFRWYWLSLHLTTALDVLLQPLVDRRLLRSDRVPFALASCVALCCCFALPVLLQHVSEVGATLSYLLGYLREQRAASNFALAFVMTEVFELWTLLAGRYSLVFD